MQKSDLELDSEVWIRKSRSTSEQTTWKTRGVHRSRPDRTCGCSNFHCCCFVFVPLYMFSKKVREIQLSWICDRPAKKNIRLDSVRLHKNMRLHIKRHDLCKAKSHPVKMRTINKTRLNAHNTALSRNTATMLAPPQSRKL